MQYHDNMTPAEKAQLLAECNALDQAYAEAEAFHHLQYELWREWENMTHGYHRVMFDPEWEDHDWQLRKAALDHRGRP